MPKYTASQPPPALLTRNEVGQAVAPGPVDAATDPPDRKLPRGLVRLSDPAVDATPVDGPPVVAPLIAHEGRVTLVHAREKDGKSTLLAGAVAAVTRGHRFLEVPLSAGAVLWVGEEAVGDVKRRLLTCQADLDRAFFIRDPSPDRSQATSLWRLVSLLRPRWIIIDTWQHYLRLHGTTDTAGAGSQSLHLGEIADLARESEAAVTIAHHNQKSAAGDAVGAYRDSTAIGATVDMIVAMSRCARARERRLTPYGRWPQDPVTIEWVSDGSYRIVRDAEAGEETSPAGQCPPLAERVLLHLLRLEPQSPWPPARELARALDSGGRRYERLRSVLVELREGGLVEYGRPPDAPGRRQGYRLTTEGRARADAVRQTGDSRAAATEHGME